MLSFPEILARFGGGVRRGKDYRVRCPVHGDTTPSLDIAEGDTGIVFLCRSAGCQTRDILAAVGLTWADVLPPRTTNGHGQDIYYDYRDAAGITKYRKVRTTPKGFYQQHPTGSGGWVKGRGGAAVLPYRLPELAGHARIWIAEGEKDADRLWSIGLPATCNVDGAKKWAESDSAHLKAIGVQRAIITTHNDDDGRAHVKLVAASLEKVGITSLTLPPFEGLPIKGDVSDWLDLGHTRDELEALVLAQTPTKVDPFPLQFWKDIMHNPVTPTRWVVNGLIPAGGLNFLVAKPKVGKTTLARTLAVAVAQGGEWFGMATEQGEVWYLMYEGRLSDASAHLRQLGIQRDDPLVIQEQSPAPGHLNAMFDKIRDRKPVLVIVDHMQLALQIQKMNDTGVVTLALQPFIELSRDIGTTFLFLAHARKGAPGGGDEEAIDALAGAGSFGGACDTYMLLRKSRGGAQGSYRTIETEQRIGEPLSPTILQFNRDSGQLHFAGDVTLYRAQTIIEELFQALEAANLENDRPTESAWFAMVKGAKGDKITAKTALLKAKRVTRVGGGKKNDPYLYVVTAPRSGPSQHVEAISVEPASDDLEF